MLEVCKDRILLSNACGRRKKKKKNEEERRRKKMNEIEIFKFGFSNLLKVIGTFEVDIALEY